MEMLDLTAQIQEYLVSYCSGTTSISDYHTAAALADQLVQDILGDSIRLPVDVEKMATVLGFEIEDDCLKGFDGRIYRAGQIEIGQTSFTKKNFRIIRVERNLSRYMRRYVIACGFVYGILHQNDEEFHKDIKITVCSPIDREFMAINTFALFLLMPINSFFLEWAAGKQKSISSSEWMKYLAERYEIPEYYTACGYQQLLTAVCWAYGKPEDIVEDLLKAMKKQIKCEGMGNSQIP